MAIQKTSEYEKGVFINCPFDEHYEKLLYALIFAIHDCGFVARCALEASDSGKVRFTKILDIIRQCRFGIHDISRTELSRNGLPRFNMPLELGLFLGAKEFDKRREKVCLVLDRKNFRYQKFCSDIAGQDIQAHNLKVGAAIEAVRDWLQTNRKSRKTIPGGTTICQRYRRFLRKLPTLCQAARLNKDKLIFVDRQNLVIGWIKANRDWRPGMRQVALKRISDRSQTKARLNRRQRQAALRF
jgi:hypothetical protein